MSASSAVQYFCAGRDETYVVHGGGVQLGEARETATMVAVVDSADELYTTVNLPAVARSYMQSLMKRRLEREFPDCSLRAALRMPRRRSDGQNDVIMIAVAADAALEARIAELGKRFALRGVVTPSLLVCAWMKRARARLRRVLVVLPTPAGLRLVFAEDGVPGLSRLMPPVDSSGSTATEIARTIQYLQNTQRVDRNEPIELWFWGLDADQVPACVPTGVAHVVGTTPVPARMPDPVKDGFNALLALAADHFTGVQLARDQHRLGWFAREAVRWGRYAAAAVLLLCGVSAGGVNWRIHGVQHESAQLSGQVDAINSEHASLEQQLSDRGLKLEDIRVLPDTEQALRATEVRLEELLGIASHAIGAGDSLHLQSLEFSSGPAVVMPDIAQISCDGDTLPQVPSARLTFSLTDGLAVRSRADALHSMRTNLGALGQWKPTERSAGVGAAEALSIAAGVEPPIVTSAWTACLMRAEVAT